MFFPSFLSWEPSRQINSLCWINKIIGGLRVYRLVDFFALLGRRWGGEMGRKNERLCNVEPPIISPSVFLCYTGEDFVFTDILKGICFWCVQGRENIERLMMRSYFNDRQKSLQPLRSLKIFSCDFRLICSIRHSKDVSVILSTLISVPALLASLYDIPVILGLV